jgi:O-antigen/teichoic acid export membrane protein
LSARAARREEALLPRVGWSAFSTVASFVASAVTSIAISRLVDPAEYGRVSVVMSSWGFLTVPINWCGSLIARFGPIELERSGRISRALGTRLVFAAPALAVLAVLVPLVVAPWAGWSPYLVFLTCAFLLVSVMQDLSHWTAIAAQGFRALTVANVLTRALPVLVVLAPAVLSFTLRAEHLLTASVAATAVGSTVLFSALRPVARLGRPDRALLGTMWRYIAPALVGVPAASLIMWVDPIVLSRFVSRSEVGHYQLAYLVMTVSAMAASSLTAVLSPELVRANARGNPEKQALFVRHYQPRLVQVFGLGAFAVACLAEPLVLLVVGPQFAPSGRIAAVLCVAAGFQMATSTLYAVVTAADGQPAVQTANVLQAALNVGGDVLLGARFGAAGVALANVLAWLVGGVSLSILLRGKAPIRLGSWAVLAGVAPFVLLFVTSTPPLWSRFALFGALATAAGVRATELLRSRLRWATPVP